LYDLVSPDLSDLVDVIKIRKLLSPIGDAYNTIQVPIEAGTLQNSGIMIVRKDYYYNLKTYCLLLRKDRYPHGVEALDLYFKTTVYVAFINPGRFYDQSRKFNEMVVEFQHRYQGTAKYTINKKLQNKVSKDESCKSGLNWLEDDCKMAQLVENMDSKFGCIAPWMAYFTKELPVFQHLQICQKNSRLQSLTTISTDTLRMRTASTRVTP